MLPPKESRSSKMTQSSTSRTPKPGEYKSDPLEQVGKEWRRKWKMEKEHDSLIEELINTVGELSQPLREKI